MLLAAWMILSCRGPAPEPAPKAASRPNILVVDIDTLRADRVGAKRDGVAIMQNVEALAARGVRFDNLIAQGGWTLPSLSAFLSGSPARGALERKPATEVAWIDADVRTLPEILVLFDYTTAVFYGGALPSNIPVFSRGFTQVSALATKGARTGAGPKPENAKPQTPTDWLATAPPEPWFALVHDIDLHVMASVPNTHIDRFSPNHPPPCVSYDLDYVALVDTWADSIGLEAARELARAHYDAAAAFADSEVGRILSTLAAQGAADRTIVVFLSDHGEELFERGHLDHGAPYDVNLRVPLIVFDPRNPRPGTVVAEQVQTIDLAPTLLELAGIPLDATMWGQSLVPLLHSTSGYDPRPAVSITDPVRVSIRTPQEKFLRCASAGCPRTMGPTGSPPVFELYDLTTDPGEQTDLSLARPERVAELKRLLDTLGSVGPEARTGETLPEEARKTLRERGYWEHVDGEATPP